MQSFYVGAMLHTLNEKQSSLSIALKIYIFANYYTGVNEFKLIYYNDVLLLPNKRCF